MGYRGRHVLVTGGLGFIGSNLVHQLLRKNATVTVVDSMVPGCGGDRENLTPLRDRVRLIERDIGEYAQFAAEIPAVDVVFNLAGEISHIHSMRNPARDLALNTVAHLNFLSALAESRPGARVVYAGTRQVYGRPTSLPVTEDHPTHVVDFNGVHKLAAAQYHHVMTQHGRLDALELRLTNVYGPRLAIGVEGQGFLSVFIRRVLRGEPLEVFGTGQQIRDPLYVDDAVEAFLDLGLLKSPAHRVYNVGGPEALTLNEIAAIVASGGREDVPVRCRSFPESHQQFDIGSYRADYSRLQNETGWKPKVTFEDGIRSTFAFYQQPSIADEPVAPLSIQVAPAG